MVSKGSRAGQASEQLLPLRLQGTGLLDQMRCSSGCVLELTVHITAGFIHLDQLVLDEPEFLWFNESNPGKDASEPLVLIEFSTPEVSNESLV